MQFSRRFRKRKMSWNGRHKHDAATLFLMNSNNCTCAPIKKVICQPFEYFSRKKIQ